MAHFSTSDLAAGCLSRENTEGSLSDWEKPAGQTVTQPAQTPSADTLAPPASQARQAAKRSVRPAQPGRTTPAPRRGHDATQEEQAVPGWEEPEGGERGC